MSYSGNNMVQCHRIKQSLLSFRHFAFYQTICVTTWVWLSGFNASRTDLLKISAPVALGLINSIFSPWVFGNSRTGVSYLARRGEKKGLQSRALGAIMKKPNVVWDQTGSTVLQPERGRGGGRQHTASLRKVLTRFVV